jgi:hypothetical protein
MRELYIYYKILVRDESMAVQLVLAAQGRLMRSYPGLAARLLRRPLAAEGLITFMEVYAMSDDAGSAGIDSIVGSAIEDAAEPLRPYLQGTRHIEAFTACV